MPRSISARRCSTNSTTDLPPYAAPFAHRRHLQPCGAVAHDAAVGRRADGAHGRVGVRGGGQQFDRRYGRAFRGVSLGASRAAAAAGVRDAAGPFVGPQPRHRRDDGRHRGHHRRRRAHRAGVHRRIHRLFRCAPLGGVGRRPYRSGVSRRASRVDVALYRTADRQPDRSGADAPSLPARADSRRREHGAAPHGAGALRSVRPATGTARRAAAGRRGERPVRTAAARRRTVLVRARSGDVPHHPAVEAHTRLFRPSVPQYRREPAHAGRDRRRSAAPVDGRGGQVVRHAGDRPRLLPDGPRAACGVARADAAADYGGGADLGRGGRRMRDLRVS